MSLFTPHGLKIRYDEYALEKVIEPLKKSTDFNDLLMDVELWELLPIAMAEVAAIITAFITGDWLFTLVFWIIGLLIGGALREITYSDLLRRIFPLFLGSGPIVIVATIVCGIYLGLRGEYLTIIVLIALWFLCKIEAIITSISLAPLIYFMGKACMNTHVERAFITLCNKKARKLGIVLDWVLYENKEKVP
jgi:hypothetical protein